MSEQANTNASTILYWFSGTGNSLVAAKELAARLGGAELVPMARALGGEIRTARRVGLVFPVHAFGPPLLVAEFLRKLPVSSETYLFAVATNGGMIGQTFRFMRQILAERALSLAAGWGVHMPGNCLTLYGAESAKKQDRLFAKAPAKLDAIARAVAAEERGTYEDSYPPLSWLLGLIWRVGTPHFGEADRKFHATGVCTHCGLCERICPVGDIKLVEGRPTWLHHCQQCLACIQWCPVEAIQYGKGTQGRKRYRQPRVIAGDLCAQASKPAN
jgi:ferredoxin